jgi:hypothetical protein
VLLIGCGVERRSVERQKLAELIPVTIDNSRSARAALLEALSTDPMIARAKEGGPLLTAAERVELLPRDRRAQVYARPAMADRIRQVMLRISPSIAKTSTIRTRWLRRRLGASRLP